MKKYALETYVGIFVLIGLLCVAYLTVKLGKFEVLGGDYYIIKARFSSVSGFQITLCAHQHMAPFETPAIIWFTGSPVDQLSPF